MPRGINLVDEATIQGRLWSPAQFPASTLAVWLDAADTSTISGAASSVSEWRDKSGNSCHATQPTVANQPSYVTVTINGRNTLSFSAASSQHLLINSIVSLFNGTSTPFTVMYAGSCTNSGAFTTVLSATTTTSADYFVHFGYNPTNNFLVSRRAGNVSLTDSATSSVVNDQAVGVVRHTFNGSAVQVFYNGTSVATGNFNQTSAMGSNLTAGSIAALRRTTTTNFPNINLGEIVICNTALSTQNHVKLEGYLNWKWGILRLPASHIFTNRPPLIGD